MNTLTLRALTKALEYAVKDWIEWVEQGPGGPIKNDDGEPDDDDHGDRFEAKTLRYLIQRSVDLLDNGLKRKD